MAIYNLASRNRLLERCDLDNLSAWFQRELNQLPSAAEKTVLGSVGDNLEIFVRWSKRAVLLWPECNRVPPPGKKHKYFKYPDHIKEMARAIKYQLDGRPNGPCDRGISNRWWRTTRAIRQF